MEIIKSRRRQPDSWVYLGTDTDIAPDAEVIIPIEQFEDSPTRWLERNARWGLLLEPDTDLEAVAAALSAASLIAIRFPKFTDGRGYSLARLLRQRYGYAGELRAIGDINREQLMYLERCGFDAFELKAGRSIEDALSAFEELPTRYQSAADSAVPIWQRRLTG